MKVGEIASRGFGELLVQQRAEDRSKAPACNAQAGARRPGHGRVDLDRVDKDDEEAHGCEELVADEADLAEHLGQVVEVPVAEEAGGVGEEHGGEARAREVEQHQGLAAHVAAQGHAQQVPGDAEGRAGHEARGRGHAELELGQHLREGVEAPVVEEVQREHAEADHERGEGQVPAQDDAELAQDLGQGRGGGGSRRAKLWGAAEGPAVLPRHGLEREPALLRPALGGEVPGGLRQQRRSEGQEQHGGRGAPEQQPAPVQVPHPRILRVQQHAAVELPCAPSDLRQAVHEQPPVRWADLTAQRVPGRDANPERDADGKPSNHERPEPLG
mmetsp:Transcript_21993/g.63407  ORF Transcript_21993/g.63407 Transcript_21993/m.63407 type:complete len:329 (+) Transcript_21993:254-1240(+)